MTASADMEEIKDSLMEVLSLMTDLTLQFNEMPPKELDTTITNCLKFKVPPAYMISLYQLGTQIANLRTLRWNLFLRNEKARDVSASVATSAPVAGDPTPVVPTTQAEEEEAVSAPKLNAYHAFIKEMRPAIAKENPDMTPQDVMKELGRRWAVLKAGSIESTNKKPETNESTTDAKDTKKATGSKKREEPVPTAVEPTPSETKKRGGGKKAAENEIVTAPAPVPEPEPVTTKKTTKKAAVSAPTPAPAPAPTPAPASVITVATKKITKKGTAAVAEPVPVPPTHVPPTTKEESSSDSSDDDGKTKKKVAIPKYIKTLVWNQYIGEHRAEAVCACCRKTQINVRHFHCGHVIAEAKGGDSTINNLRPICSNCNLAMGTMSMNEFAEKFLGWKVT